MSNKLTKLALDLLLIERDLPWRLDHSKDDPRYPPTVDDFEVRVFEQTWGSTALGFPGIGGQAMTSAPTFVFIPNGCNQKCFVYFGGRFAYAADWTPKFIEDLRAGNMVSVSRSGRYRKKVEPYSDE